MVRRRHLTWRGPFNFFRNSEALEETHFRRIWQGSHPGAGLSGPTSYSPEALESSSLLESAYQMPILIECSPENPWDCWLGSLRACNLHEAIRDLEWDNKRNRSIRESLQKSICHVKDVIPGAQVVSSMPTLADIESIPHPSETTNKGTTQIQSLSLINVFFLF